MEHHSHSKGYFEDHGVSHYSSHPPKSRRHLSIAAGVVILLAAVALVFTFALNQEEAPADSSTGDEFEGVEPIEGSSCLVDADCASQYGQGYFCYSGLCYSPVSGINDNTNSSGSRSSGGGGSSGTSEKQALLGFFSQFSTGNAVSGSPGDSIYYNDGWVGIGTSSPTHPLDVAGDIQISGHLATLNIKDTSEGASSIYLKKSDGTITGSMESIHLQGINTTTITSRDGYALSFWTEGVERVRVTKDGKIGIGTSNPELSLDVVGGGIRATGINAALFLKSTIGSQKTWSFNSFENLYISEDGTPRITLTSGGNVGIGTPTPTVKLDVMGSANFAGGIVADGIIRTKPRTQAAAGTCNEDAMGSIYFSEDTGKFYGCTGLNWVQLNDVTQ